MLAFLVISIKLLETTLREDNMTKFLCFSRLCYLILELLESVINISIQTGQFGEDCTLRKLLKERITRKA